MRYSSQPRLSKQLPQLDVSELVETDSYLPNDSEERRYFITVDDKVKEMKQILHEMKDCIKDLTKRSVGETDRTTTIGDNIRINGMPWKEL